jgi:hypothetical protein
MAVPATARCVPRRPYVSTFHDVVAAARGGGSGGGGPGARGLLSVCAVQCEQTERADQVEYEPMKT